ncbi:MAG: carbohydrate binding domain-containing protein [Capsulimonas sp.]|uniref:carbohydrate binding domain-containing protein n=1 Tax=Capsulimonas sp. TaxID=2494211 RepID=UPI00326385C9
MKLSATLLTLTALPILAAGPTLAADPSPMFPFVLPWDDATHGVITDVSFLNDGPAGAHGKIVAKNGHFVESKTGKRIKFLATNFVAKGAFPSHADAEKVARRVAKLGINLVRFHHMDNSDWGQESSIWDYNVTDRRHISASQLDKLDYLIAQLKKNGVYVNLNLHVSRKFSEADGFPASVSQITFGFDKRVDEFDRTMIARQKEYAHDLLTHVNPYTKLSYVKDPAVAVVEINNENSLVGDPWATLGADLDTLPDPFKSELTEFWNAWLAKKYGTDEKLKAAWLAGVTPVGFGLLTLASEWSYEHQGASQADFGPTNEGAFNPPGTFDGPAPREAQAIKAEVRAVDGVDWHVQAHMTGLDLANGGTYTVTFRAKSDAARTVPVAASLDQDDWRNVGLGANAALTTEWKTFRYVFTAHDAVAKHVRLAFTLGGQTGTVWIAGLQIHSGADGAGLQPGESLAAKNIAIPSSALKAQHDDWIAFLADTERAYANEMRAYLKRDLGVQANIICSQMGYGGLTSIGREAAMDFADNHAYWQHPSFPHKPWDSVDWNIGNTPMAADLAAGKDGTLLGLARYRVAGKPYSISEYNHAAPNDFRAETLPELATFAASQDWDMIYLFDYGDYGTGAPNDKIGGFFGIGSDPAKTAFLPAAAMIFRAGTFLPSASATTIPIPARLLHTASIESVWRDPSLKFHPKDPLNERLAIAPGAAAVRREKPVTPAAARGKARWVRSSFITALATNSQYVADSPGAQAFAGYYGGHAIDLNSVFWTNSIHGKRPAGSESQVTLQFPTFGNNFAAGTLTAMDGKPVSSSHKLLLTLVGKVENQEMGWNADRTSVGNQWGHGPTIAEGVPATITMTPSAARRVWALDATGKRRTPVPATYKNGALTFTVGARYKTVWYEIGQ